MVATAQGTTRGGLWKDSGVSNLTNSTAETTIFSANVAGGIMNLANKVTFLIGGGLSTAVLTPGSLTFRVKYGTSTTIVTSGGIILIGSSSDAPYRLSGFLTNKSTTSSQYMQTQLTATSGGLTLTNGVNLGHARPAMDSTLDQTLAITAQFSVASTSNILTVDYLEVTINS